MSTTTPIHRVHLQLTILLGLIGVLIATTAFVVADATAFNLYETTVVGILAGGFLVLQMILYVLTSIESELV